MALRSLDLCSGYGGFALALSISGIPTRTVCHVEREAFAAATLVKAMEEGRLDPAPVWSDLSTFDARPWRGVVDLVTAGFPCQPWSVAGKRGGESDERYHGVWPNIARIVGECRPHLVFLENVVLDAFRGPRADLEALGYRVPPAVRVSAGDVGAPHDRERWWVLAHSDDLRELQPKGLECHERRWLGDGDRWPAEPEVPRVDDGSADRASAEWIAGNGIVPLAGAVAFRVLLERLT